MDAHGSGANDGKIHSPITYVQSALTRDPPDRYGRPGHAQCYHNRRSHEQSGMVKLTAPHFGNLFAPDEVPTFTLGNRHARSYSTTLCGHLASFGLARERSGTRRGVDRSAAYLDATSGGPLPVGAESAQHR